MIYRIAKEIGGAAVVLYGKVDAILLTGGMAHSEYITSRLQERVSFLAPVHVYPGEDELEALVMNALGALRWRASGAGLPIIIISLLFFMKVS